jgi:Na+/proline symporter
MIQRLQTVYYILSMICLGVLLSGMDLLRFVAKDSYFAFNVHGISQHFNDTKLATIQTKSLPLYLTVIGLILLQFMAIMSYKNLNRQFQLARSIFFLYLVILIAFVVFASIGYSPSKSVETTRELGIGFIFLVLGFPFAFLGQVAIKRDKKLLDSLNRLR